MEMIVILYIQSEYYMYFFENTETVHLVVIVKIHVSHGKKYLVKARFNKNIGL